MYIIKGKKEKNARANYSHNRLFCRGKEHGIFDRRTTERKREEEKKKVKKRRRRKERYT